MEPNQQEWLKKLGGQAILAAATDKYLEQRDQVRAQLQADMTRSSKALLKRTNLEVEDASGSTLPLLDYEGRDQTTEFDIDDQQDGYTLNSDQSLLAHIQARDLVTTLSQSLDGEVQKPVFDKDGNPMLGEDGQPKMETGRLFSEEELGKEFYQPLVRQGLLPETNVPNQHSQTHALLEGSFEAYKERLDADVVTSGFQRFVSENSSLMLEVANLGVAGASSAISFNSTSKMTTADVTTPTVDASGGLVKKGVAQAEGVMKASEFGWDMLTDKILPAAVEVLSGGGSSETANRTKDAKKAATFIVAAASEAAGQSLKTWQLDVSSAAVVTAKTDGSKIAVHLAAEELTERIIGGVVNELATGLSAMFAACDPKVADSGPKVQAAAKAATETLASSVNAATVLELFAATPPKYPQAISHFGKAVEAAMTAAIGIADFKALLDDGDNIKKTQKGLGDEMTKAMVAEQEASEAASEKELAQVENATDARQKAGLLEKQIAKMEKYRSQRNWAAGIMDRGFEAASAFLAPMAIAGSAIKLALLTYDAIERTRDFNKWASQKEAQLHAASPYSAAVANFVHNADQQSDHLIMQQAAEFCNLVGLIVETAGMCSGPGALVTVVVGKSLQIGAKIAASVENVLNEIAKRQDLEKAWQSYREALLRPENRKLGLIAVKKNPTLAKYAMAWGAVIKKDPLVGDFMRTCQLDAETLEDPKTNIALVVKYLEVRMPDDNVVVGRNPGSSSWEPDEVTLTVSCWMGTVATAEKEAKLVYQDTGALEADLIRFEAQLGALEGAFKPAATPPGYPTNADITSARDILNQIGSGLRHYAPELQESKKKTIPHVAMLKAVKRFQQAQVAMGLHLEGMAAPPVPVPVPVPVAV